MSKRLMRSTRDRWIGGVCGGLAHYFEIDPTWVRLAFLLAFFLAGTGPLVYLILWLVMPAASDD